MIHQLYDEAASFHGHKCPGLAIGVRAAAEAKQLLGIQDIHEKGLWCVAESAACYLDGIQLLLGCTVGNGNLILRNTGKCAFSFYRASTGESIRLILRELPEGMERTEKTEYILAAPLEQVFDLTEPRQPMPTRHKRMPERRCAVCGELTDENAMRVKDGLDVCMDCAEA